MQNVRSTAPRFPFRLAVTSSSFRLPDCGKADAGIRITSLILFHGEDAMPERPFRATSSRDAAEAAFKKVTTKPVEPVAKPPSIPDAKEQVTLRIDRDVLEYFQDAGPGWQQRINDALRKIVGK